MFWTIEVKVSRRMGLNDRQVGPDTSQGPFVRRAYLGYLPPQIMKLALQCALLAESSAQGSFLGIEKSLQVLEPGLRSQQIPLLLGIARKEKRGFQDLVSGTGPLCDS